MRPNKIAASAKVIDQSIRTFNISSLMEHLLCMISVVIKKTGDVTGEVQHLGSSLFCYKIPVPLV